MPRGRGYKHRSRRRRLTSNALVRRKKAGALTKFGKYMKPALRGANRVTALYDAAVMAHDAAVALHPYTKNIPDPKSKKMSPLAFWQGQKKKKKLDTHRHEKLKSNDASGPVNKGKGHNKSAFGTIMTHPRSRVPKWKHDRLKDYKYDVWQTVLVSRGTNSRVANSDNILKTFRYPYKAVEALDNERVQTMVFSPYCSGFTGIHTTFVRKIRADGTDLDHFTTQPLDVIQNKTGIARHHAPNTQEATFGSALQYEHTLANGGVIDAAATQSTAALANNHVFYDQIFKQCKVDLKFISSRVFKTKISICLVRHLKPVQPYHWTTEHKQQLFNNLDNRGLQWEDFKTEWLHEFVLPGLKKGKSPPTYNVKKNILMNVMQTNAFNDNNTAQDMAESSLNQLGLGLRRRQTEVADGHVSGMTYLLIKYRKVQAPQQFQYTQVITEAFNGAGYNGGHVELPVLTEESFDVPQTSGQSDNLTGGTTDGAPFKNMTDREDLSSFYVHGTIKYRWGFRGDDTEAIPSVMDERAVGSAKKTQSLNIDPTLFNDTNNGIYTQSQQHQTRAT